MSQWDYRTTNAPFPSATLVQTSMGWTAFTTATGTAAVAQTTGAVTGTGTKFKAELPVGTKLMIGTHECVVTDVTTDTAAVVSPAPAAAIAAGAAVKVLGEVLIALRGLAAKATGANTDFGAVVTFTLGVPANKTYTVGEVLTFTVTASEGVVVTGTPTIDVTIGSTARKAAFDGSKSTKTSLVFEYKIVTGDADADGIAVASTMAVTGKASVGEEIDGSKPRILTAGQLVFTNTPVTTGIKVA